MKLREIILILIIALILGAGFLYHKLYVSPLKNYIEELEKEREVLNKKIAEKMDSLISGTIPSSTKESLPPVFEEAKKSLSNDFLLKESENQIEVEISTDEIFEKGGYQLSKKGEQKLDKFFEFLKKIDFKEIEVEVHTDRIPIKTKKELFPSNWELSARRATEIVRYLISKGVESAKIFASAYGYSRPIEKSLKAELQKKNRRAVFKIIF